MSADAVQVAPGHGAIAGWRRLVLGVLVVGALFGCWRLGMAWIDGTTVAHDFLQDYAMMKGVLARENPYQPLNDVMLEVFGPPRIRARLWPGHWPSSLPFLLPIAPSVALGSHTAAFLTWGVISLAAFLTLCGLTLHALGAPRPFLYGLLLAPTLIVLPPIWENFAEGQLNPLVALGIATTWVLYRRGQPALAGLSLGLAFGLKPVPGLFFLYFAWRRQWRLLAAAGGVLLLLNLGGLALAGVEGYLHYFTVNYPRHAVFWTGYPDNASLAGLLTRMFGPIPYDWPKPLYPVPGATPALTVVLAGLLAGLVWLQGRGRPRSAQTADLELAALSVLSLLVAPYIWPHYYVFLATPIAILVTAIWPRNGLWDRPRQAAVTMLAVSLVVLSDARWSEPPRGVGGLQLMALFLLFGVCVLAVRLHRSATVAPQPNEALPRAAEPA